MLELGKEKDATLMRVDTTGEKDRRKLWMHKYIMEHDKHLDIRYGNNKSCIKRCGACRGHIYLCRL